MNLRILYDNEAKEGWGEEEGLKSDWGFSCLVEAEGRKGEKVLFDTGASAEILSHNLRKLGIKREEIEIIALSHEHWDHVGGLETVLHENVVVYLPRSFTRAAKRKIEEQAEGVEVVEVSGPAEIVPGVHTTGELETGTAGLKEQSLVLEATSGKGGEGVVVLTGCAHPGLENILEAAGRFGEVYGVVGGFHGFDRLELLAGLELVVPCHCTVRKQEILERFPKKTAWCGAGVTVEV